MAPLGHLGQVGTRAGIEQRQPGDAFRRLAHDFQGDIAAHRQAGERKAWRRRCQNAPRDRGHAVIAGMVGDNHRPNCHSAGICPA